MKPPYLGNKTNRLASCPCCMSPKPRDGNYTCNTCVEAGCFFDCGWKRGGRGIKNDNGGKPLCPSIRRAKRNGSKAIGVPRPGR